MSSVIVSVFCMVSPREFLPQHVAVERLSGFDQKNAAVQQIPFTVPYDPGQAV